MTNSEANSISRIRQVIPQKTNEAVLDKQRQTSSATWFSGHRRMPAAAGGGAESLRPEKEVATCQKGTNGVSTNGPNNNDNNNNNDDNNNSKKKKKNADDNNDNNNDDNNMSMYVYIYI